MILCVPCSQVYTLYMHQNSLSQPVRPIALFNLVQTQYNLTISIAIRAIDSHKISGTSCQFTQRQQMENKRKCCLRSRSNGILQLIRHSSLFADQHHLLYLSIHHQCKPVQDNRSTCPYPTCRKFVQFPFVLDVLRTGIIPRSQNSPL